MYTLIDSKQVQNPFTFGVFIRILRNFTEHLNTWFYDVSFLNVVSILYRNPYGGHLFSMIIKLLYLYHLHEPSKNYDDIPVVGQSFFFFLLPPEILPKWPYFSFIKIKNCSPYDIPFPSPTLVELFLLNFTSL